MSPPRSQPSPFPYPIFIVASPSCERPFDNRIGRIIFLKLCSCFLQSQHAPAAASHIPRAGSREGSPGMSLWLQPPWSPWSPRSPPSPQRSRARRLQPLSGFIREDFFILTARADPNKTSNFPPRASLVPSTGGTQGRAELGPVQDTKPPSLGALGRAGTDPGPAPARLLQPKEEEEEEGSSSSSEEQEFHLSRGSGSRTPPPQTLDVP